jgi:predicted TIM-barrel fold metal-dependent hydrolase
MIGAAQEPLAMMLSSDSHVVEPPDLWATRVDRRFRDRSPRVVPAAELAVRPPAGPGDAGEWWCVDGLPMMSFSFGAEPGKRFEGQDELRAVYSFDEVRRGGYLPDAHLAENEADGVYGSVLYPSIAIGLLFAISDSDLLSACIRAYNDWLAEFCSHAPGRLKGVAMLNIDDVAEGVAELTRARDLGLAGAAITVEPPPGRAYDAPEYEPLWAAAEDLAMPLSLHIGSNRGISFGRELATEAYLVNVDHAVRMSLAHLIFSGVFERHPRLRVGAVEHELSWIPHFLERMDYLYGQRYRQPGWNRFEGDALPSDFWRSNCFASFQEDALGIRLRDIIGVGNLAWGSDYPHTESTFPRSRELLGAALEDVDEEHQRRIVFQNTKDLYGFDLTSTVG